jgi:hypothetical protein
MCLPFGRQQLEQSFEQVAESLSFWLQWTLSGGDGVDAQHQAMMA